MWTLHCQDWSAECCSHCGILLLEFLAAAGVPVQLVANRQNEAVFLILQQSLGGVDCKVAVAGGTSAWELMVIGLVDFSISSRHWCNG